MAKNPKDVPQAMYSVSGSKELLQRVLNDPKYTIRRWNPAHKDYDIICPYEVFRTVLKKTLAELKYPNKSEAEAIASLNIKVCDELAELLPELVAAHLDNNMKFRLPMTPDFNGVIFRKFVPAGSKVSQVRNIQKNCIDGEVRSEWDDHFIVKCSSSKPKDKVRKTRL